jgi:hypothetical protein
MSFKVMVVPEDPTYDSYILKPLVKRLMEECGKPNAAVQVVANPKLGGYSIAKAALPDIAERYAHFNLFLFLPDADGKDRAAEFAGLERDIANGRLLCCAAVQEVETWLLAGYPSKLSEPWSEVRSDISVKERYFEPFLAKFGNPNAAGGGREQLMKSALENFTGILSRSPELADLQGKIKAKIS